MGRVDGKVVLVTGAASGIGLASANLLVQEGAAVMYADINHEGAQAAAEAARQAGARASAVYIDLLDRSSIAAAVAATTEQLGGLNILVNNAGGNRHETDLDLLNITDDAWQFALDFNLTGTMHSCQAALPHLLSVGGGTIVNVASVAARGGDLTRTGYCASKAGVISLTRSIATQYGKQGIRCNSVSPGLIMTPAIEKNMPEFFHHMAKRHNALDTLGRPEDIGYTVLFLASDEARFITGQNIEVEGGGMAGLVTNADMRDIMAQMHTQ